jgi:gliding motility-associated lipoprotein GldJ
LPSRKSSSSTTGWAYNTPKNGGFEYNANYSQAAGPGLVYVQGGTFPMGRVEQDVIFDYNNVPRRVTVASFYMDETEVRNVDWREYLYWLQRVYPNNPEVYKAALPDTLVWRSELAYNEPFLENRQGK